MIEEARRPNGSKYLEDINVLNSSERERQLELIERFFGKEKQLTHSVLFERQKAEGWEAGNQQSFGAKIGSQQQLMLWDYGHFE